MRVKRTLCIDPKGDAMTRTLDEISLRAITGLLRASEDVRAQCLEIARNASPKGAFNLALQAARIAGYGEWESLGIAKATRWLAVIRRDHGLQELEQAVRTLVAATPPTLSRHGQGGKI